MSSIPMDTKETVEEKPFVAKSTSDLQRLKLMKLMKNPEKPVLIPEKPRAKNSPSIPEFVRNVMGSSAGAGSGEFHVYRHLRRKEYSRQKFIQEKGQRDLLDEEHHKKLAENKKKAEEATMKRRNKRLKKKGKRKEIQKLNLIKKNNESGNNSSDSNKSGDYTQSKNVNE